MKIAITGGSRGIGKMLAEHLKEKNEIVIISKNQESLKNTAKKLEIKGYCADVTNYKDIKQIFEKIEPFDILINCAGILGPVGFLLDNDGDLWEQTIKINLIGTVNCCKASIPFLSENGKIINFSGGGSAFPRIYHTAYACSKAAVVRFTEVFAKELEDKNSGIKVNVIAPGRHKTYLLGNEAYERSAELADPKDLFSLIDTLIENDTLNGKFIHIKDDKKKLSQALVKICLPFEGLMTLNLRK